MSVDFEIRTARGEDDLKSVRDLFRAYQDWLDAPVCFQDFEAELTTLPGEYAPPKGEIFLAVTGREVAGIVAVRPVGVEPGVRCEMKRLYVREAWRGRGLGRQLAERSMAFAQQERYQLMVLDTLPKLDTARGMYSRMGFVVENPYYSPPLPGVVYMERIL